MEEEEKDDDDDEKKKQALCNVDFPILPSSPHAQTHSPITQHTR